MTSIASTRITILSALLMSMSCATIGAHRIDQVYYLGVFDPTEQLPPSLYRVRVIGKADWFSSVNYAAGWVPAELIDSLGTSIRYDKDKGSLEFESVEDTKSVKLETGRRLVLFGPEGFREAPAAHRLAIVMSSDPSEFFQAIDEALGQISAAKALSKTSSSAVNAQVLQRVLESTREQAELFELARKLEIDPEGPK